MTKLLDFILDMKNILSLGALAMFIYCTVTGLISGEQAFAVILMTFSFFLGKTSVKKAE